MSNDSNYYTTGNADWDNVLDILLEDERVRQRLHRDVMHTLLFGRQGFGKNLTTAAKIRQQAAWYAGVPNNSSVVGAAKRDQRTALPPKICDYRKPKVDWYGTETLRYSMGTGFKPFHFDVSSMFIKGRDPRDGLSVWPAKLMGSTTGRKLKTIAEQEEWVQTKTFEQGGYQWKPQGEIIVMGGKPLKIKEKG